MATPTDEPAMTAPTVMAQSPTATRGPFEPRSDPAAAAAEADSAEADAGPAPVNPEARPGAGSRLGRLLRRHALFGLIAAVALAARGIVVAAYQPALMYLGDSGAYLDQTWHGLWPADWRPSGYPMFLRLVRGEEHLTRLVLVQQSLTFLVGVVTYAVAVRVTRRPWLATLCAAPVLLSPWVLDLGQFVLAETLFSALTGLGLLLLAVPGRPRLSVVPVAGLLLGASLPVRTVGYGPLAVGFVVLALTVGAAAVRAHRSGGVSRLRAASQAGALLLSFGLAAAAPICAYSGWSASEGAGFTVSAHSGFFLYGRVAPFADCSVLPADRPQLSTLCDPRPVADRGQPDSYLWLANSPLRQGHTRIPKGREQLAGEFADAVIRAQPGMLLRTSADYFAGYFAPTRHETSTTSRPDTWELPDQLTNAAQDSDRRAADGYFVTTRLNHGLAGPLAAYARLAYAPMPLVGAGLVAGLLAVPIARLRRRPGPPPAFWLLGGGGLSVLALSAATAGFDYRYLASVIGILGAAAILGAASLARALRRGAARTMPEPGAVIPSTDPAATSDPAATLDRSAETVAIP
ncbi:hypothetical protein [Pseudofrankia inefficax]|uniref:Glycosyltransferase RgtA/B/C/D-like domain-containing protein n=1 Tax=Pseudofrankia inefficax (strain DSM 45817 / CECT 9037 / DDB 130130 / EuI1c) TaxID=298654 RepID=E3J1Y0_PSEI1|nr:hypothetical protein [Pseudofrankia inefficax]ADP84085.1 hypothetical protein FraEuI1c_6101 [Pseudofrankia inefficax]